MNKINCFKLCDFEFEYDSECDGFIYHLRYDYSDLAYIIPMNVFNNDFLCSDNYFCINVRFKDFDYKNFDIIESAYCTLYATKRNNKRLGILYLNNAELKFLVMKSIPIMKDKCPISYY